MPVLKSSAKGVFVISVMPVTNDGAIDLNSLDRHGQAPNVSMPCQAMEDWRSMTDIDRQLLWRQLLEGERALRAALDEVSPARDVRS
jgi:hypothetical protein